MIVAAFALQNSVFPFVPFLSVGPNLLLIIVFTIAFVYGEIEGVIYGALCGVLMDLFYGPVVGYYMLVFIWIGYMNGLFSRYYYENYIMLPVVLCAVNESAYNLYLYVFRFLVRGKFNFLYYLRTIIVPEIIITVVFTLLLYRGILACNRGLKKLDAKKGTKVAQ